MRKMFIRQIAMLGLWFALALPSLAQTNVIEQSKKKVKPYVPIAWEWEQKVIAARRQEFLDHIKGASNISIPKAPDDFSWEIDWDARQAYCSKIAEAFFASPPKLKFPEPFYSKNRDSSTLEPTLQEIKTFEHCEVLTPSRRQKWVQAISDYAADVNLLDPQTDLENLKPPVEAIREYAGHVKNESASETFSASRYTGGNDRYSIALYKAGGAQCRELTTVSGDRKIYEDGYLVAGGRTSSAHSILVQIGNELIATEFGTYEVSKGDAPIFGAHFSKGNPGMFLSISADGNSINVSDRENGSDAVPLLKNIKKNQTWGAKDQGFVIIKSALHTLSTTWAKTDPYKDGGNPAHDQSRGLAQPLNEGEFACVINYDKPLSTE